MIWQWALASRTCFHVCRDTRDVRRPSPSWGKESRSFLPLLTALALEAAPQVPWLEPLRRQVQHHGKGSSRVKQWKTPGALPKPLTGVCCDGSPERLVDPCLELNLFHDSANLPRLALRLRLRLSALSSRSEQPRSISVASLHFFPMLSSPRSAGQHPSAESSRRLLSPLGLTPAYV